MPKPKKRETPKFSHLASLSCSWDALSLPADSPVACFGHPKGSKRCVGELVPRRSARVHSESGQPRESRTFGPSMDKS